MSKNDRATFDSLLWATTTTRGGILEVWREPSGGRRIVVADDRGGPETHVSLTAEALLGLVRALDGRS